MEPQTQAPPPRPGEAGEPANEPIESTIAPETRLRAARVVERVGFKVTGLVLTHPSRQAKAIVDYPAQVRWFPTGDDFKRMMNWQATLEPGQPPAGYADEHDGPPAAKPPLQLDVRPSIAIPATVMTHDSAQQVIEALARELGCVHNTMVASNSGWFVPGRPTAYVSPYDAIKALVDNLKQGGTVYMAPRESARPTRVERPVIDSDKGESPQGGLF
ncbi:hypothetical protein [Burkholderia vietnamiensis]|uniref:hypothetical protein n=1 Tax=Burkholderia vietnamiensis TaxID=60552 RepID=UPI000AA51088|nr:hypothetical protein [Burkholderia vietnamiensis]MBR8189129.1 hypothetical protein [Burkholderia vietnamiensis]